MYLTLFAIKDKKMDVYSSFHTSRGIVDAIRGLTIAANRPDSQLNQFPEDYQLCQIAEIDDTTGLLVSNKPSVIAEVTQIIKPKGA
ncbi:MAG: nonstructural protein [Microvirus sp.]|nr:MAG: nonstructural protein [Microvirus sp.]